MKTAVVTRADDNTPYIKTTFKSIIPYAEKIGADFIQIKSEPQYEYPIHDGRPHYRIFKIYDLFEKYDRIFHIDADCVISPTCPNIFEEVPENKIGACFEDVGYRAADRRSKIANMQKEWGDVGWRTGYTNAGVYVVSKMHRDMFRPFEGKVWTEWGSADLHMGYMVKKLGYEYHELNFRWNHMIIWNNEDRMKSNIIHYAGAGWREGPNNREQQMAADHEKWYG